MRQEPFTKKHRKEMLDFFIGKAKRLFLSDEKDEDLDLLAREMTDNIKSVRQGRGREKK